MPFRLGEHVKASRLGWYGQVVARHGTVYQVRVGGTITVRTLNEGDLEPLNPDRRIAPHAFPPVNFVPGGGAITLSTLAYPFSNEKGLTDDKFWVALHASGIDPGAFLGVSGSILDFARHQRASCLQIISTDINTETVKAIDSLRTVVVLINEITTITYIRRRWKHPFDVLETRVETKGAFLDAVITAYKGKEAARTLDFYTFDPAPKGEKLKAVLRQLEGNCYGKLNFSSWYQDNVFLVALSGLIAEGLFSIVCGDLQNAASQAAMRAALRSPVSLFNFSNALDYIRRPDLIADLFEALPHTAHAKVVTSSQIPELEKDLGTFFDAKIHAWNDLIAILRRVDLRLYFGRLLP